MKKENTLPYILVIKIYKYEGQKSYQHRNEEVIEKGKMKE